MVSSKIGRNDPCFCGSGKKYKKCCLAKESEEEDLSGMDPLWREIRKVIDGLSVRIVLFAEERFGEAPIAEAWSEFMFDDESQFSGPDRFHLPVFFSWFSYNWIPDPYSETYQAPPGLAGRTVSGAFLQKYRKTLSPLAVRYIEACQNAAFSFYDILSVESGTGLRLRDIVTEEEFDIVDRAASTAAVPGKILFGNVVRIDHLTLMDATAPYLIPVEKKPDILLLKSFIRKTCPRPSRKDLAEYDFEILALYQAIMDELRNPEPPRIFNTDEELLAIHEITYDIGSPRQAFDLLKDLSVVESEEEMLRSASFDAQGRLLQVTIPWSKPGNREHASWDNTILGQIEIRGETLSIQTNSDNRAQKIREIVEERLSGIARFHADTIVSQKDILKMATKKKGSGSIPGSKSGLPPETNEAAQTVLKDLVRRNMLQWPGKKIPMLGDRTPMEAVLDPDGRELVESLLLDMEQREVGPGIRIAPDVMEEVRKTLGLGNRPFRETDGQG